MILRCSSRRLTHKFHIMIKDRVESLSEIFNCSKTITIHTTKLTNDNVRIVSWEFKDCLLRCWDNIVNTTASCLRGGWHFEIHPTFLIVLFTWGAPNTHSVYDMLDIAELALIYMAFSADYILKFDLQWQWWLWYTGRKYIRGNKFETFINHFNKHTLGSVLHAATN